MPPDFQIVTRVTESRLRLLRYEFSYIFYKLKQFLSAMSTDVIQVAQPVVQADSEVRINSDVKIHQRNVFMQSINRLSKLYAFLPPI